MNPVELLRSPRQAAAILMHPLRPRILELARAPISAAELARRLAQPRQRVNYHVRQLAEARLLRSTGQQQKRNMVEQLYIASAQTYLLAPDVLGPIAPRADQTADGSSPARLVTLCSQTQSEVAQLIDSANAAGLRIRTFSLENELHFDSAAERAGFIADLTEAIDAVVADYRSGSSSRGRAFRLITACYPLVGA